MRLLAGCDHRDGTVSRSRHDTKKGRATIVVLDALILLTRYTGCSDCAASDTV